ncbi:MAG: phage portal protein [Alphaproteobacteria bacterium]|nr:phage portal protein [Alphaproteobacteria bacterium]
MVFRNFFKPRAPAKKDKSPDESKASRAGALLVPYSAGEARFTPRQYDRLADEGYRKNVVAYRCIRLVSQNAAAVPWVVTQGRGADKKRLHDHPLVRLLSHPNPMQGGAEFFAALYGFYLIAGNGYMEAAGPKDRAPLELWNLRPDRMRVVAGAQGVPKAYRYSVNGQWIDYPVDGFSGHARVLHVKSFHPLDDWYGMSPLEAAAFSIDQHNEAAKWNAALLQSSARPSGALVYRPAHPDASDALSDAQRESLKSELARYFSGGENAGRPLVLEGGLDWRDLSLSPKDMDWLAGRDVSARDIAQAFHVPPQLVGITGSMTFANFEQARLALFDDAVLPLLDHVKDALNGWLAPRFGADIAIDYDTDGIEALAPRREKTWQRITAASFMTVNEKRAALGLPPVEGGDKLPS